MCLEILPSPRFSSAPYFVSLIIFQPFNFRKERTKAQRIIVAYPRAHTELEFLPIALFRDDDSLLLPGPLRMLLVQAPQLPVPLFMSSGGNR